jgi:hypothetical protein
MAREDRYFGCVQTVDDRPKRRIFEVLRSRGLQMNQDLVFLTDGGDNLHSLVEGFSPCTEHYLDWFHITMPLTVLGQYAKGLAHHHAEEAEAIEKRLERIKWRLWHGDAREALIRIEDLAEDLDELESDYPNQARFVRAASEFATYIRNNRMIIPNYGERRRNEEPISTAFVESTVNVVVDKRFAKKQQMQWSKIGAHRLVQIRTRTLDGTLRETLQHGIREWRPTMPQSQRSQTRPDRPTVLHALQAAGTRAADVPDRARGAPPHLQLRVVSRSAPARTGRLRTVSEF